MTICIGALSDNKKKCYLKSDCLLTTYMGGIIVEYETSSVEKIRPLDSNFYVLTGGDVQSSNSILDIYKKHKHTKPDSLESLEDKIKFLKDTYSNFVNQQVVDRILKPRDIHSLQEYIKLQKSLSTEVINFIESSMNSFNLDVEFLIAAKDSNNECHIYTLSHKNRFVCHDHLGFACVGNGSPIATASILSYNYSKDKKEEEVIKIVDNAKEKSEFTVGVGKKSKEKSF